ncbi:hypothetical protein BGX38DRAFT_1229264 [Terfezia claveryi]|nr:hypothetical protein BGX38DRAFT_1229264 [Terfezia claveryi]
MGMGGGDPTSVKAKLINLISAVRMLMRSTYPPCTLQPPGNVCIKLTFMGWIAVPLIGINTIIILYELILG